MIDVSLTAEFCIKYKISTEELFLLFRIVSSQNKNLRLTQKFKEYSDLNKETHDYSKLIRKLEEKKLLTNLNKDSKLLISNITINEEIYASLFIDKDDCFNDVIENYPNYLLINGKKIPSIVEKGGILIVKDYYYNLIEGNRLKHDEIIRLIQKYFSNKDYAENKLFDFLKNIDVYKVMINNKKQKETNVDETDRR